MNRYNQVNKNHCNSSNECNNCERNNDEHNSAGNTSCECVFVKKYKSACRKISVFFANLAKDPDSESQCCDAGNVYPPSTLPNETDLPGIGKKVSRITPVNYQSFDTGSYTDKKDDIHEEQVEINQVNEENASNDSESSLSPLRFAIKTAELINEYDRRSMESVDDIQKSVYEDAAMQLTENLIHSGCKAINPSEGETYDFDFHVTRPFVIREGQMIERTVRMGVRLGDRILVKAIVTLKEENHTQDSTSNLSSSSIPEIKSFSEIDPTDHNSQENEIL